MSHTFVQKTSSLDRATGRELAELVNAGKDGAVIVDVESGFRGGEFLAGIFVVILLVLIFVFFVSLNKRI